MAPEWSTDFLEILGEVAAGSGVNTKALMKILEAESEERHLLRRHNIYSNLKRVVSEEAGSR